MQRLWTKVKRSGDHLPQSARWIHAMTSDEIMDCVLWWTEFARLTPVAPEDYAFVMHMIIAAWPPSDVSRLREHIRGERQIVDRYSTRRLAREERDRLIAMSSWLVSVLITGPLRT